MPMSFRRLSALTLNETDVAATSYACLLEAVIGYARQGHGRQTGVMLLSAPRYASPGAGRLLFR